jgi:polyhydroxyalkanoate synthesis regulator phasin
MGFESVRGYVQLASGLGELTRARATEVAQGLLSSPRVGVAKGKAAQVGALAEELMAAATINREHLNALVRSEVDAAVTRLGLVPAAKLEESQAETSRLRRELASLRSASSTSTTAAKKTAVKKTAVKKTAVKKTAAGKTTVRNGSPTKVAEATSPSKAAKTAKTATTTGGSAVSTRRKPAGS